VGPSIPVDSGAVAVQDEVFAEKSILGSLMPRVLGSGDNKPSGDVGKSQIAKPFVAIVDDDLLIRNLYNVALKALGFQVVGVFCDGKDIVDKIAALPVKPEVIVMDERMPNMNGLEACTIILGKYPGIRVIFVTADDEIRQKAIDAGARGFLTKPISMKQLADMIISL
jgi:CheY-like chemotaxis protein